MLFYNSCFDYIDQSFTIPDFYLWFPIVTFNIEHKCKLHRGEGESKFEGYKRNVVHIHKHKTALLVVFTIKGMFYDYEYTEELKNGDLCYFLQFPQSCTNTLCQTWV